MALQLDADPAFYLDPDPYPASQNDADPDPASQNDADPDQDSQNYEDPCGSESATLHGSAFNWLSWILIRNQLRQN
jgi:hypothetical protein